MDRRRFLLISLAGVLAAPLAAAQQAAQVYRLGWLSDGPQTPSPMSVAFADTLRELGYVEGRNLVINRRYAAFNYDRLPELAADLVRLNPDVFLGGRQPPYRSSETCHDDHTCRHDRPPPSCSRRLGRRRSKVPSPRQSCRPGAHRAGEGLVPQGSEASKDWRRWNSSAEMPSHVSRRGLTR